MKYRELGKTGMEVSEVGLGAWQIGGALHAYFEGRGWISHGWGAADDAESMALIRACGDLGINFIDTAAGYGAGHSEEVVGRAVENERERWIIETKGGEGFTEEKANWKDFSRAKLLSQIDESLGRLRTDYVDVYLLHGPSQEDIEKGECLEALDEIKASGKARFTGVSLGSREMGLALIGSGAVDVLQVAISITNVQMAEELLPAAEKEGVGIVARGVFGSGFYTGTIDTGAEFSPDDRRSWQSEASRDAGSAVVDAFRFLEGSGRTLSQSLIKYILSFEAVSTVITGSKSRDHMGDNAGAVEVADLTEEEMEEIGRVREKL